MGYFAGLILIMLLTFSFAQTLKRSLLYCLPFSILSIVSLLYIFGLFTILNIGAYITAGLIVVFFIVVLILTIKKHNLNVNFNNFPFIIFCVISILQFFVLKNRVLDAWDEFSHWGSIVKNMFLFGNFGNIDIPVLFPGYPPATGAFHSFFMFLGNKFVEGYLYMSMNLLSLSLIMPIFEKFSNKITITNVLILAIGICVPMNMFNDIYVDIFLGLLMGYIVYTYFLSEKIDSLLIVNLSLASLVLCATKEAGLGICLIALIIISIDLLCFRKHDLKEFLSKKRNWFIIILPITAILFAKISWTIYKNVFNLIPAWSTSAITLSGVINYLFNPNSFQKTVTYKFFTSLLGQSIIITFVVVLCFTLYLYTSFKTKKYKRDLTNAFSILGGFVVYAVSLLVLYIFTYSEYEALNLASFNRYFSTYLTALIMITFVKIITTKRNKNKSKTNTVKYGKITTVVLMIISVIVIPSLCLMGDVINYGDINDRQSLKDFTNFTKTLDAKNDKVYYIYCNSKGRECLKARFEVAPIKMNVDTEIGAYSWSPGSSRYDGDIWSWNVSADEWEKTLIAHNFTHIYLHNVDEIFINTYSELFESVERISNYSRYKIVKISESDIKIIKL